MKQLLKPAYLPLIAVISGAVGLLLRLWLFTAGVDATGHLQAGHPGQILLWVVTALILAVLLLGSRSLVQGNKYSFNFPASAVAGIGCILAAVSFAVTSVTEWGAYLDTFTLIASLLGMGAAASLVYIAYRRWTGGRAPMLLHAVVCLCLMFRLINQYRHWSSDPQLADYCFQLLATICLLLSTYHRTAFDVDLGSRRSYTFFRLAAVYFCLVCLIGGGNFLLYFGMAVWQLSGGCNVTPIQEEPPHDAS